MLRLALTHMRTSAGRLVAAGLAIALGVCFVTVTFLATTIMEKTVFNSFSIGFGKADLIVEPAHGAPDNAVLTTADVDAIQSTPGVNATSYVPADWFLVQGPRGNQTYSGIRAVPTTSDLIPDSLALTGHFPVSETEVAIPKSVSEELTLHRGDTLMVSSKLSNEVASEATNSAFTLVDHQPLSLTVVGILDDSELGFGDGQPIYISEANVSELLTMRHVEEAYQAAVSNCFTAAQGNDPIADIDTKECVENTVVPQVLAENLDLGYVMVTVDRTTETVAMQNTLRAALPGFTVSTKDEVAAEKLAEFTGDSTIIPAIMVGFAAISLFVAGLVITNTFQVIVAQRTRTLALLRCVGATRSQIGRSVLIEAAILGVLSSIAGLLGGLAISQGTLWLIASNEVNKQIPSFVAITPPIIVVPILTGIIVTIAATITPAIASTRVLPLAALRPLADAPKGRTGLIRTILTAVCILCGFGLLALAISMTNSGGDAIAGLALGIVGGFMSFLGVLFAGVYYVPAAIKLLGKVFNRFGVAARLAVQNSVRNPRRTAATATALIIGVTLVTLMSVGADSAKRTLDTAYTQRYPFDVQIAAPTVEDEPGHLNHISRDAITSVPGVKHTVPIAEGKANVKGNDIQHSVSVYALDPEIARTVVLDPSWLDGLKPGTALLGSQVSTDIEGFISVTRTASNGEELPENAPTISLESQRTTLSVNAIFVVPQDYTTMGGASEPTAMWAKLNPAADAAQIVDTLSQEIANATTAGGTTAVVSDPVVVRSEMNKIIDIVLLIITGLLAVAVVIALIGVANTLALSVIERRRESAMLRALGMTRGSLRATLAIEGTLIAGIGAILGTLLGIVYGIAGAATVLAAVSDGNAIQFAIPWTRLGFVIVIAIAAGLLASVLPARRAAQTPPVAALALD